MQQQAIPINPAILQWARLEAGLSLHDAVQRAKITAPRTPKDTPALTAEERLEAWENGRDAPSLGQLESVAKAYRRPLITFFLPAPPQKIKGIPDFRTVGNTHTAQDSPEFSALKRKIVLLHDELRILAEEERKPPLAYIASLTTSTPVQEFVSAMRRTLGATFEEQCKVRDETAMLRYLRTHAHATGIFVLFEGNLGSHHSSVSPEEFRGIAFADKYVPLIAINPNDAKAAMVFTFVHELAHLWLGCSGISNFTAMGLSPQTGDHESFCNRIAAEFLVPEQAIRAKLKEYPIQQGAADLHMSLDSLGKFFKVSGAMIATRLLNLNYIDNRDYSGLLAIYQARWAKKKERQSQQEGAPSPAIMAKYRLGEKVIQSFIGAARDGRVSLQDAARILGVPVRRFGEIVHE